MPFKPERGHPVVQLVQVESGDGHVGRRVLETQTTKVLKWENSDQVSIDILLEIIYFWILHLM